MPTGHCTNQSDMQYHSEFNKAPCIVDFAPQVMAKIQNSMEALR